MSPCCSRWEVQQPVCRASCVKNEARRGAKARPALCSLCKIVLGLCQGLHSEQWQRVDSDQDRDRALASRPRCARALGLRDARIPPLLLPQGAASVLLRG
jgi:hypothetical protein